MSTYLIEIVLVFLLWQTRKYKVKMLEKRVSGRIFYLCCCFLMFGMTMALRKYTIGTDTSTYYKMYQDIAHSSSLEQALNVSQIQSALVYVGLHYCITRVIYFPQLGMFLNSLIISVGFFVFIKGKSKDYLLSCVLFIGLTLFYESMNGTRQFMAIALAINAFSILEKNKKNWMGWLLFALAVGIHNTIIAFAISYLGVAIVKYCKNIRKIHVVSTVVSVCMAMFFTVGVRVVVKFFPYYEMYVNGRNPVQIFSTSGKGRIAVLYLALYAILTIGVLLAKTRTINSEMKAYHFGCTFCTVIGTIFSKNVLMCRMLWSFLTLLVVYIPDLLKQCSNIKIRRLLYQTSMYLPLAYSMIHLVEDKSGIVPYVLFWR